MTPGVSSEDWQRKIDDRLYRAMVRIARAGRACSYLAMEDATGLDSSHLSRHLKRLAAQGRIARRMQGGKSLPWEPVIAEPAAAHPDVREDGFIKPPSRERLMAGR